MILTTWSGSRIESQSHWGKWAAGWIRHSGLYVAATVGPFLGLTAWIAWRGYWNDFWAGFLTSLPSGLLGAF